jgi:glyoxylase-like metal-dependent hydrolase (beta-lactamase superfamily II)
LACALIALGALACASGSAKESSDLTKLAEGVYARIVSPDGNAVSNSGIVLLDHSVLVFDTHFTPDAAQALLAGIRSITSKPVRYVVNSHAHADHTHGNQVFPEAQLISSTNARRDVLQIDLPSLNRTIGIAKTQLEKLRQDMGRETDAAKLQQLREQIKPRENYLQNVSRLKILAPFVTLDDSLTIQDGKLEARIAFLGVGHTDGDIILYLPSQKIAFVGDLFFNQAIPNVQDASILPWMKTLEEVLKLDADRFVPGHGPVGSKKDVEGFLSYFGELKSLVEPAVAQGESMEQAIREIQVPAKYASYRFQNFFPSNIQKMYAELKALQLSSIPAEGPRKTEREKPSK